MSNARSNRFVAKGPITLEPRIRREKTTRETFICFAKGKGFAKGRQNKTHKKELIQQRNTKNIIIRKYSSALNLQFVANNTQMYARNEISL